jgi:hypothetical protein
MQTELGYKIRCIETGWFKHRAGGVLWSEQGDIYYSLAKAKSVIKSHTKYGAGKNRQLTYEIIEYEIKSTGKTIKE